MNEIIMNSRGDQGLVRSMIISFEVCEADNVSASHSPALLLVRMANNHEIGFEVIPVPKDEIERNPEQYACLVEVKVDWKVGN